MATIKLRLKRRPPQWFLKEWYLTSKKELKAGYITEVDTSKIDINGEISDILGESKIKHSLKPDNEYNFKIVFPENNKYSANFPLQWFEEV